MAARVLGRNVYLMVNSAQWLLPIALGELDEFRATSTTEMVKSRPIGFALEAATLRYGGYDLQFKIAKNNPMLERWNHLVDRGLIGGSQPPELFIFEIVRHSDALIDGALGYKSINVPGTEMQISAINENWIYKNVTLFSPEVAFSGQGEYDQSIQGFAAYKELGPVDTTFIKLDWLPQIGFQEVVYRTKDVGGGIAQDITSLINSFIGSMKPSPNKPGNPMGTIIDPKIDRL